MAIEGESVAAARMTGATPQRSNAALSIFFTFQSLALEKADERPPLLFHRDAESLFNPSFYNEEPKCPTAKALHITVVHKVFILAAL